MENNETEIVNPYILYSQNGAKENKLILSKFKKRINMVILCVFITFCYLDPSTFTFFIEHRSTK